MTFTLPEERALMGQAQGQGSEPVSLDVRDDDLSKWKEHARRVMDEGGHFPVDDMHQVLARLVLGL